MLGHAGQEKERVTAIFVHLDTAAKNLAGVFLIGFPDVLIARYHGNRLDGEAGQADIVWLALDVPSSRFSCMFSRFRINRLASSTIVKTPKKKKGTKA